MPVGLLSANTWDGVSQPAERIVRVAVVTAVVLAGSLAGLDLLHGWREVEPGPLLALKYTILLVLTADTASHPSPPLYPQQVLENNKIVPSLKSAPPIFWSILTDFNQIFW